MKHRGSFRQDRLAYMATVKVKGRSLVCICLTTFMNLSGKAVKYRLEQEKLGPDQMLVVVDDVALPLSRLRL